MKKLEFSDLTEIENEIVDGRYYVHNGYYGFAYGSPLNPKRISNKTALDILNRYVEITGKNPIPEMKKNFNDLVYTEAHTKLFQETMGNRITGYYAPDTCVFDSGNEDDKVYSFQIS